ncbi:MauE/DoxX family redox-associated membrane protein [Actinomadura craniellae]|uniref:MauE/DoxX family redox-associated membrane protein n=1 Tax=Actinomadura craniellae TaxID=2231787 RepID=UPI001F1A4116|nr:MauE/DoxX family redox-associated membrane protein [Actinomadura craniellae]
MTEKAAEAVTEEPGRLRDWPVLQPWLSTAARVALAVVLAWAGWAKFTLPTYKQELSVEAYQLLPHGVAGPVGIGLPLAELLLAAFLLVGFATRFTAAVSALLMLVFIAAIISAWSRGLTIDCGCFGGGGQVAAGETRYLQEILRDIGFLALAVWITVWPRSRAALDNILLYRR